ncbi:hypothetical protein LWI29_024712 [Acer saccharum]|uniref:DUF2921 domain-containing protein n=1 Tax=Acer saccharum TaxID=4024 RepID=A0AA39W3K4_ACESA|nr:hypothetical protein LWI29_024712 [Acer saccharum]
MLNNISSHSNINYPRDNNKFQSFQLQTKHVIKTDLEASLIFNISDIYYDGSLTCRTSYRRIEFSLKGFLSEYTGELCMVGTSSSYSSRQGNLLHLTAVLQLSGVKNSTITSLIRGTLQSLSSVDDPNYFEPISILMFPEKN